MKPGQHYVEVTHEEDHVCEQVGLPPLLPLLLPQLPPLWRHLRYRCWFRRYTPACHSAVALPLQQSTSLLECSVSHRRLIVPAPSTLQTLAAVRDMNALFDSRGRRELPPGGPLTPSLAAALAAGQGSAHSGQQKSAALGRRAVGGGGTGAPGRLLISNSSSGRQPAAAEPQPSSDGSYVWRSDRMPWEVAASGQRFVREHVRMQDALLYIR